jgi:hypothetical protein
VNVEINYVSGLPFEETAILRRLIEVWSSKKARNLVRNDYYFHKNRVKDFGISVPDKLQNVQTVVGWPAKAVDALAVRSRFDGFAFADGDDSLLRQIVGINRLKDLYRQAATSELINSCSFLTVSAGAENEPDVIISAYSALFAAGEWDRRHKRIKHGLTVVDTKIDPITGYEEPVWVNLYTDTDTWEIKKDGSIWTSRRVPHEMGRPMIEPLVFRPSLERPFGISRISRAVMSITDSAMREALRTEVGAEFYTSPQKYILGADEGMFEDGKWSAYMGSILALTRDENGDMPQVGMFSQGTMQPHMDYMRALAARFSGETSIPISELGVIHDNPSSAEAIYAAKESLVCEAEDMNETNGNALCEVAKMAMAIAGNKAYDELSDSELSVMARFKNPSMPSTVSQADAMCKVISVLPWVSESDVALEELGFSDEQMHRMKADKQKSEAKSILAAQLQAGGGQDFETNVDNANMYKIASIIKSFNTGKISIKNAITLFSAIGIDEERALEILGDGDDVESTINGSQNAGDSDADSGGGGQ